MLILVPTLGLFFWIASKGVPRRDDDLIAAFTGLLGCPSDHPFLLIRKLLRKEFLQFCRYDLEDGSSGLRLVFPIRKWSRNYEEKLSVILKKKGFLYYINEEYDGHFLVVDFDNDVNAAQQCSQLILREVFGFSDTSLYRVHLEP